MLTRATSRSRRLCLPWLSTCPSVPSYARCCVSRRAESGHVSASKRSYATYKWIEDVEPFERYVAGGYYPVRIGDEFCSSRYRIVHKLGYGASSTTWLARDEHLAKYVAIKFAVSSLETPSESAILKTLWDQKGSAGETHADIATIPEILDEFDVDGPEIQDTRRRHRCMVTIPARMSVSEAREASYDRLFQPLVARAIAAQLIQTVAFLHSRGIVHADLHEANLLLRMSDSIDNLTPDQLYGKYGQPELEQIKRIDGQSLDPWVPTHGVVPIWLGDASDTLSLANSRIFLSDFSESFRPAVDAPQHSHTPFILRSPELLLEPHSRSSFLAEIWSLACAVFAIMGQRPLFETWFPSKDRILEEHADALGCFPKEWWTGWVNRNQFFDDQGRRVDGTPRQLLEDRFEASIQQPRRQSGMAEMNEEEKQHFLVLLMTMVAFRPGDRPSAQQVLESSWMQKWGKPALESIAHKIKV